MSAGVLDPILHSSQLRLERLIGSGRERLELAAREAPAPRGFRQALSSPGVSVVAEMKRRSPSAGELCRDLQPAAMARDFEAAGAAAISVLTDPEYFSGSLEDLVSARGACQLAVLRKDFVVDDLQVFEARAAGADAVLLIVRALARNCLGRCLAAASDLAMTALVEVHDEAELDLAGELGATVIGINNRDLDTLVCDLATTERLAPRAAPGTVLVAESGIREVEDLLRLASCGVDAVLIGEALMRSPDPGRKLAGLVSLGVPGLS